MLANDLNQWFHVDNKEEHQKIQTLKHCQVQEIRSQYRDQKHCEFIPCYCQGKMAPESTNGFQGWG